MEELYQFIEERAHERIKSSHWKEKIRQTVRGFAVNIERGVWASQARAQAAFAFDERSGHVCVIRCP